VFVQFLFDAEQFLLFVFFDRGHRNAGPAGDHLFDVLAGDDARRGFVNVQFFAELAQVLLFLALLLGVETRLFELVICDGGFHAVGDELDALDDLVDLFRQGGLAQLDAGAGFINQVNGLIREEAIRDVPVREIDGIADGFVGVSDGVKFFVAFADALQDPDGLVLVRAGDLHGLEAPLERAIFFD
jgi:hypothetical protein